MASETTLQLDNIIHQGEHGQITTSSRWTYLLLRGSEAAARHREIVALIQTLQTQWSGRIALPYLWTRLDEATLEAYEYEYFVPDSYINIAILTAPLVSDIEYISEDDVLARQGYIDTPEPDFCLARYKLMWDRSANSEGTVHGDARHTGDAMARILCCPPDDEKLIASALYGMLCGIPNCRMTCSPLAHFPPSFLPDGIPQASLDFCVMPEPCHPAPHNLRRASLLGPTLTHPALLVAINTGSFSSYDDESSRVNDIARCLALHAEPLHALLETWRIRHNASDSAPVPPLPEYAIVYGIAYDVEKVDLFAHFWSSSQDSWSAHDNVPEMVSLHIDSFNFTVSTDCMTENLREQSLGRLRLGVALLTIQKQLYRMASLWEDFDFPCNIRDLSDELDNIIGGMEHVLPKRCLSNRSDLSEEELWAIEGWPRRSEYDDEGDYEGEGDDDDDIDLLNFDQYRSLITRELWLKQGEIERIEEWANKVVVAV